MVLYSSTCCSRASTVSPMRSRSSERGATFFESALAMPVAILLIVGLAQFYLFGFRMFVLHYSLERAARIAVIDNSRLLDMADDTLIELSREESTIWWLQEEARRFGLSISADEISICPLTDADCTDNNIGTAGEYFILRARKEFPFPFNVGSTLVDISVMGRTEPA